METITNQAYLTFEYGMNKGCARSNIAIATINESISLSKLSLNKTYSPNETIFYILDVTNSGKTEVQNLVLSDNLGTYPLGASTTDNIYESEHNYTSDRNHVATPLSFIGPAQLYIDGVFDCEITPLELGNSIQFTIPCIPSGSNAMILYKAVVNNAAPLALGSVITNIVTYNDGSRETISTETELKIAESADVKIVKSMNPSVLSSGDKITYTFTLYNYGNIDAINVVMTDTFSPAPTNLSITVGGRNIDESNYIYVDSTLTIPSSNTVFPVKIPAATFIQDEITGIVSSEPGVLNIVVEGILS